jgi:hypothetical protein
MDQKKKEPISYQEGAGSLLLMAAAQETGLLAALEAAIGSPPESDPVGEQAKSPEALEPCKERMLGHTATEEAMEHPAASQADGLCDAPKKGLPESFAVLSQEKPRRLQPNRGKLAATLLFLGAVGVHRTWDLRSYSGDALGLLIGRKHAYSYSHTEQYLSALAKTDAADRLTNALLRWTSQLWHLDSSDDCYVDGHHKPVYSQHLIPRGLIGRTHQILGCRGLMLLHDSQGHPLLVLTGRGDWHVMDGLVSLVERLEQIRDQRLCGRIVVDREGMGAAFRQRSVPMRITAS